MRLHPLSWRPSSGEYDVCLVVLLPGSPSKAVAGELPALRQALPRQIPRLRSVVESLDFALHPSAITVDLWELEQSEGKVCGG